LSFDYEFTKGTGHATELARRAVEIGYPCLVVVGGDGTVNEVANGILGSTRPSSTMLGILSAGSECSFAHSLGIAQDLVGACSLLIGNRRAVIDVGVVQYHRRGQLQQRFFVNVADVGFPSDVVDSWKRLPSRFGRRINHALRTIEGLRCLVTHRNKTIKLHVDNDVESILACTVVMANGQYFADGMQIAPHASMNDGLLDVLIVGDVSRYELLKIWPTLYKGSHIRHSKIEERTATTVMIESEEPLLVEADGVILGESPASFRIIPSALNIVV
jgi:YegS/Rv2252/BmrU family lipid kinase